ncbi:MAG: AMP-binding protein [Acidimicrobiia bacterium]
MTVQFNLGDLFERVADAVPDRTALVADDRRRTYAELRDRSGHLARALADGGVGVGGHVGLCMRNTIEHVESMLACYLRRAVPINMNWRYSAAELAYLVADAELSTVIVDPEFEPTVVDGLRRAGRTGQVVVAGGPEYETMAAGGPVVGDLGPRSADDLYVLYTGGTTGLPKGVVWRQEDIFFAALGGGNPGGPPISRPEAIVDSVLGNPAQRITPFLGPTDPAPERFVSLAMGPLMHASGSWGLLGTLLGGGTFVLDPAPHFDAARVLDLVEREQVGLLTLVGDAGGRPIVDAIERAPDRWDLSSVRVLGSGGSMLSADVKRRLLDGFPRVVAILEGMGSSESPAQAVAVSTRAGGVAPSLTFAPKAETIVVDDDLRPVPPGQGIVGRLATRGRVPIGYRNDAERTARTFVTIDGQRYALPGDRAVVDADGTVRLVGRGSTCINTGGEKVYPEEVEAVLVAHRSVDDAVVVGVPDPQYGAVVAAVVSTTGEVLDVEDLRSHCRERLAGYKIPRRVVVVDEVRRSPAGKPDHGWARSVLDRTEDEDEDEDDRRG